MTTDKDRLDFLQALNDTSSYTGHAICRWSNTGRGWRLHETSEGGYKSVREAIDALMQEALNDTPIQLEKGGKP